MLVAIAASVVIMFAGTSVIALGSRPSRQRAR